MRIGSSLDPRPDTVRNERSGQEVAGYLGADSLGYLSHEGLLACERDPARFCSACFTGRYPVAVDPEADKLSLERMHREAASGAAG